MKHISLRSVPFRALCFCAKIYKSLRKSRSEWHSQYFIYVGYCWRCVGTEDHHSFVGLNCRISRVSWLFVDYLSLKMKELIFSGKSVTIYQSTQRNIPKVLSLINTAVSSSYLSFFLNIWIKLALNSCAIKQQYGLTFTVNTAIFRYFYHLTIRRISLLR